MANKQLLTKLREALEALSSDPPIYGGNVRIKPRGSA